MALVVVSSTAEQHRGADIFEQALNKLEASHHNDLQWLYKTMLHAPVPFVMYDIDGTITWANPCMLGVFFGLHDRSELKRRSQQEIFGRPYRDVFPSYLSDYVDLNNDRVWHSREPQLERDWSDEQWVGIRWDVIRYPVNSTKIVAILIPKDADTVKRCQQAAIT